MFTYFHSYHPALWEAMVNAGLIDEHAGIRFCQSKLINDDLKFNELAAEGGKLHALIEETKMPLYIDRLQGGCYIAGTLPPAFGRKVLGLPNARMGIQFLQ